MNPGSIAITDRVSAVEAIRRLDEADFTYFPTARRGRSR